MQRRVATWFGIIMALVGILCAVFLFTASPASSDYGQAADSQAYEPYFVDASEIPHFDSTAEMGLEYPHILLEGEKLTYDRTDRWYHYANMPKQRALWMEFVKGDGTVQRELAVPVQHFVDGKSGEGWYKLVDGRWAFDRPGPAPRAGDAPPPAPPDETDDPSEHAQPQTTPSQAGSPVKDDEEVLLKIETKDAKWYETEENRVPHEDGWEDHIKPIASIGPDGKLEPFKRQAREHIVDRPK